MRLTYFLFLFLAACSSGDKLKLGALYNLSGAQGSIDAPSLKGAQMSKQKEFALLVRDTESSFHEVRDAAADLESKVFAFVGYSDSDMVRIAASQVPDKLFLTSGATSPNLPSESPNIYLACFGDNAQAAAAAEFALDTLGLKTVSVIMEENMEYTKGLAQYFQESFKGTIVSVERYSETNLDLSEQLSRIQAAQPDFIYVAAGPQEAPFIAEKIRGHGLMQPIFGGDSFDTPAFTQNGYMDRIYFTTHVFLDPNSSDEEIRTFTRAFEKEYKVKPDAFAALGYDAVNLMADALHRAGSPDKIEQALGSTTDFKGVTGEISYLNGSHIPQKPVTIVQIKKGAPSQAARITPTN